MPALIRNSRCPNFAKRSTNPKLSGVLVYVTAPFEARSFKSSFSSTDITLLVFPEWSTLSHMVVKSLSRDLVTFIWPHTLGRINLVKPRNLGGICTIWFLLKKTGTSFQCNGRLHQKITALRMAFQISQKQTVILTFSHLSCLFGFKPIYQLIDVAVTKGINSRLRKIRIIKNLSLGRSSTIITSNCQPPFTIEY